MHTLGGRSEGSRNWAAATHAGELDCRSPGSAPMNDSCFHLSKQNTFLKSTLLLKMLMSIRAVGKTATDCTPQGCHEPRICARCGVCRAQGGGPIPPPTGSQLSSPLCLPAPQCENAEAERKLKEQQEDLPFKFSLFSFF